MVIYSLAAQEKYAKQYCKKNDFEILKTYSFVETGSKPGKRSRFDALLKEIKTYIGKSKNVLHLVVEKPDRLTRNFTNREQLQFFVMLGKLQIHYYKDKRIIDSSCSPAEILTDNIMTALNKYTADNIRVGKENSHCKKRQKPLLSQYNILRRSHLRLQNTNRYFPNGSKFILS